VRSKKRLRAILQETFAAKSEQRKGRRRGKKERKPETDDESVEGEGETSAGKSRMRN